MKGEHTSYMNIWIRQFMVLLKHAINRCTIFRCPILMWIGKDYAFSLIVNNGASVYYVDNIKFANTYNYVNSNNNGKMTIERY